MKFILSIFSFLTFSYSLYGIDNFEIALKKRTKAEYDSSVYYFNQALLNKNINDTSKALIIIERGKSYQLMQSYDLALIDFNKGLNIFRKEINVNGIVLSSVYLAEYHRHLGRLDKAEDIITGVEPISEKDGIQPKTKALFYNRFAAIIAETGSKGDDGIILYSNKAINICKQNDYKNIEASSLNQLGYLYFSLKSEKSIIYFQNALNLFEELGNIRAQVNVIKNIARLKQRNDNYQEAIQWCDQGINLIGDNKWYFDLKDLLYIKMVCLRFEHQYEEAYETSRLYNTAYIDFMNSQHSKSLQELETKYSVIEKDKQIVVEQEKANRLKQETEQKQQEVRFYILITALLTLILVIGVFAYYKIQKSNKLLNQTIEQKEILLQEIHHRVKNNLTVLNSLLYIQADETDNKETKLILNECQTRIQSMALVHQNLYDVDDASKVKLEEFIQQLISESKDIFGLNMSFDAKIDVSNIEFDMSFTVFLGLIINELLTNTFKYAFDNQTGNWIKIDLIKTKQKYKLIYSDSGNGLSDNFDINQTGGFGFKLIKIMVNQIQGTLDYSKENNSFTIQFKKA